MSEDELTEKHLLPTITSQLLLLWREGVNRMIRSLADLLPSGNFQDSCRVISQRLDGPSEPAVPGMLSSKILLKQQLPF